MPAQRPLRVGESVRHALAEILARGECPWPPQFSPPASITVTEVRLSPDLRHATVFVTPLGGFHTRETLAALNAIRGFFRHALRKYVQLRYLPELFFKADTRFDEASAIERLLHAPDVSKDLEVPPEETPPDSLSRI